MSDIVQVTEDVYSNCNLAADSLYIWGEPSVDNRAIIDGLVPGTYYFICSVAGHCDAGMKIKVSRVSSTLVQTYIHMHTHGFVSTLSYYCRLLSCLMMVFH